MSQDQLEKFLVTALAKLEKTSDVIVRTRGYTKDTAKIKVLEELIKEQIRNESSHPATRSAR